MLELPQSSAEQDVAIESKEIPLNFDSRVAHGLVVTVRALDRPEPQQQQDRVWVTLSSERSRSLVDGFFEDVAKSEIHLLEAKKRAFPDSDILVNHLASLYTAIGDEQAALGALREGLRNTGSGLLKTKLAATLIEFGKLDEAENFLQEVPDDWLLPSLLNRAHISIRRGNLDVAKRWVSDALAQDYFNYGARLLAGVLHLWQGSYVDAIRSFKVASEERPKSSVPLVHMAAAYFALNQSKKALNALRKATALNPLDDRAVTFYSDLLFLAGKSKLAIVPLRKLYDLWDKRTSGRVLDRLAKAYLADSVYDKALQIIRERLLESPNNPSLLNNAGITVWKRGQVSEGRKLLQSAADNILLEREQLSADRAVPVINLLTLLLRQKDYRSAVSYAKRLFERLPPGSDTQLTADTAIQYVLALEGTGEVKKAVDLAEQVLSSIGRESSAISGLIVMLLHIYSVVLPNKERVLELSQDAFQIGLRKDIDESVRLQCVNNALFSLLIFDEVKRVSKHLGLISKHALKNPYVTATLGLYYFKKGDFVKGKSLYEYSVQLAADKKLKSRIRQRMAVELGKACASRSEHREALFWFERAINERDGWDYVRKEAIELRAAAMRHKLQ
jgi:tetratricopeptide (TPR) repeat protein